jgi:TnpA family transposase
LPLSAVWGDGTVSSSDGQRFGLQASSLLGALYPRYFGYYAQALTVYPHIADQHSVFHTQVIACSVREAMHVLEGLSATDTILRPKEHVVDQHAYTDQRFARCHWLGYSWMRRLNVSQQTRYKPDRATSYGQLEAVFMGPVDVALIRQQWDPRVRVAAALRHRTAPAHIVLPRFSSSAPSERLAKALTALARRSGPSISCAISTRNRSARGCNSSSTGVRAAIRSRGASFLPIRSRRLLLEPRMLYSDH